MLSLHSKAEMSRAVERVSGCDCDCGMRWWQRGKMLKLQAVRRPRGALWSDLSVPSYWAAAGTLRVEPSGTLLQSTADAVAATAGLCNAGLLTPHAHEAEPVPVSSRDRMSGRQRQTAVREGRYVWLSLGLSWSLCSVRRGMVGCRAKRSGRLSSDQRLAITLSVAQQPFSAKVHHKRMVSPCVG